MKAIWMSLFGIGVVSVCAQAPTPYRPNPYFPDSRGQINPDPATAMYQGPFYPVENEPRVYRTRMATLIELQATNEILELGAILTGFDCTVVTGGNASTISSMQPNYALYGVNKVGNLIGSKSGGSTLLNAREGYGVAKMELWMKPAQQRNPYDAAEMHVVGGLRLTFARIEAGGTLSAADQYVSPVIGREGGQPFALDTMGMPACGLTAAYTAKPSSIGLLVPAQLVTALKPGLVPAAMVGRARLAPQPGFGPGRPGGATTPGGNAGPGNTVPGGNMVPGFPQAVPPVSPDPASQPVASGFGAGGFGNPTAVDPRINALNIKAGDSFAFVEGQGGVGSAFICTYQGKRMLFTNQHVIRENPALKFTLLNQAQVKLGPARAAVAHDLMVFDIADPLPALEADLDFAANVQIGDEVLVVGNTEGERVIKPLPGQVVGIGPNLVEISSQFLPGNSGSPIIHVKSGRVIGIATYAIIRSVDSLTGARNPSVRRFGYRLDSVQQWQPVNWQIYQAEAAATTKVNQFSGALVALLRDMNGGRFDPTKHTDSRLKPAMGFLAPVLVKGNKNQADVTRALQNFMGELKNVTLRDVDALKQQLRYDFFQRELAEEAKFRSELAKSLGTAVNARR